MKDAPQIESAVPVRLFPYQQEALKSAIHDAKRAALPLDMPLRTTVALDISRPMIGRRALWMM